MVPAAVEAYLGCGRPEGGFARIRCPSCRAEHLLAFSCRTRQLCPSCQAKRSAAFAEKLVTETLGPLPHRHVVLTIPRVLRGVFRRERRLLGLLARAARDALVDSFRAILDRQDVVPGSVVSIQTFGAYAANFHPHLHALLGPVAGAGVRGRPARVPPLRIGDEGGLVITDLAIVDRILRHLKDRGKEDPFEEGCAPPAA